MLKRFRHRRFPEKLPGNVDSFVHSGIKRSLDTLASDGDYDAAETRLLQLFDTVIYGADPSQTDLFIESSYAIQLVRQMKTLPEQLRKPTLEYLRKNDVLAKELVFLIDDRFDNTAEVYAVLSRIVQKYPNQDLSTYSSLIAALCVVHDTPVKGAQQSPDVLELFDYFVRNEQRMYFGIRNVPPELLVFVVDVRASIAEMIWALNRHAGDRQVGQHFFDVPYDYPAFLQGKPKRVESFGYNLPNIRQYGGVCADQAYYAASVGKSIGVPSTVVSGASSEFSHAWVGFLQADNIKGWWNFDVGRYEVYKGVRGNVKDPQRGIKIPDGYVALLGYAIGVNPIARHTSAAFTLSAKRVNSLIDDGKPLAPMPHPELTLPTTRPSRFADPDTQLKLIDLAVTQNPGNLDAWLHVRDLADQGRLSLQQKQRCADAVWKNCRNYPDFAYEMLEPMVRSVGSIGEQNVLWNQMFTMFAQRNDLAAQVRMSQAKMWTRANDLEAAGQCYQDVIARYPNAGPFVIEAIKGAETLLRNTRREDLITALYEQAWKKIERPGVSSGPFASQSNWYRVGKMLADQYQRTGMQTQANSIRSTIGVSQASAPR